MALSKSTSLAEILEYPQVVTGPPPPRVALRPGAPLQPEGAEWVPIDGFPGRGYYDYIYACPDGGRFYRSQSHREEYGIERSACDCGEYHLSAGIGPA